MKSDHVSITAIMTAFIRGYHSAHDAPVVFNDPLALQLIPEERRRLIEQGLTTAVAGTGQNSDGNATTLHQVSLSPILQTMGLPNVISRSRYTEDNLKSEISKGVGQYVILGAGLDSFAFRHKDLLKQIHVFEVDQPGTQEFKRKRLADLNWRIPRNLHFVPADLSKVRLAEALLGLPYNPSVKSLFSLLGVTMYLAPDDVFETLRSITQMAPAGSSVIFDYHTETDEGLREIRKELQRMGESMNTTFDPSSLRVELEKLGFHLYEDLGPADIQERFFNGSTKVYHANENVHLAWAVVGARS